MPELVLETFQPLQGAVFILHEAELPPLELTLETVEAMKGPGFRPDSRPSFSLIFRCPEQEPLQGRIYSLEHPSMGEFALYLSPIARDTAGVQYQALFN